jgi:oligopeptide/dipeptide ABC transporter ATP-binding protein
MTQRPLLQIQDLRTYFRTPQGIAKAVDGVSLQLDDGEVLGVVGESGCGKSVLSLSILQLLPMPPAYFASGRIWFLGQDLLKASKQEIMRIRGNRISMIFQEPMTALNPVFTVGNQLAEVFRVHQGVGGRAARERAVEMLEQVGVPAPAKRVRDYPFELSGGMRQRVMIAMALACRPKLLIADEPTTALDVTIQAQILELMDQLQEVLGTAIVMISHDLGVIAETAHRVAVMYTGKIMETAATSELFGHPLHPYTQGLMRAIPGIEDDPQEGELYEIRGVVPSLLALPGGCEFNPRCPLAENVCRQREPELREILPGHRAACWMAEHGEFT